MKRSSLIEAVKRIYYYCMYLEWKWLIFIESLISLKFMLYIIDYTS